MPDTEFNIMLVLAGIFYFCLIGVFVIIFVRHYRQEDDEER